MKLKFNDIGRCLICLQNPCNCKNIIQPKSFRNLKTPTKKTEKELALEELKKNTLRYSLTSNMQLTLQKKSQGFDLEIDGQIRKFIKWEQGFKNSPSFEEGFYFEKEEDKNWYKNLNDEDTLQIKNAIKNCKYENTL